MGVLVIPSGYSEIDLEFDTGPTQEAHVIFGVNQEAGDGADEVVTHVLDALVASNVTSFLSADRNLVSITAKTNDGGVISVAVDYTGIIGTASGASVPPNTAVLMKKRSGLAGRANSGRMYWPYIAEGQVDGYGQLAAGQITAFTTLGADILANLLAESVPMVILHSGATPATPTLVTQLAPDGTVATQRRRLR